MRNTTKKIHAGHIARLLTTRFQKFDGAAEVKIGSTYCASGPVRRFDWWGIERTWTSCRTIGIEIKVARSDFLRDEKWRGYLPYCHELYFATAPGVIDPAELPQDVGLLVATKTGSRLLTKRKAVYRSIPIENLTNMLRFMLMWRTDINAGRSQSEMLEMLAGRKVMAGRINTAFHKAVDARVAEVIKQNDELTKANKTLDYKNKKLDAVQEYVDRLGLSMWCTDRDQQLMKADAAGIPMHVLNSVERLVSDAEKLGEWVKEKRRKHENRYTHRCG